jgi:hypothetical protein
LSRLAAGAVLLVALAGTLCLVAVAAGDQRRVAYPLGVAPFGVAAQLEPGQRACMQPIELPTDVDGAVLRIGTFGRPGPALQVTVRELHGRVLARGSIPAGYADGSEPSVIFGRVPEGRTISLCIRNRGPGRAGLFGSESIPSTGTITNGTSSTVDFDVEFLRERDRSALDLLPEAFDRASVFRPGWVGAWTYWVLLAAMLVAAPLLLALAVLKAAREPDASAPLD